MIDLSLCDDFSIGSVSIRPASREIVAAGAVTQVEPKVMQMLVLLARPSGRVVSRDEMIEHCWGGRIVGEDAINRVIGKLRRAAETAAGGAFRIETIARVGLRLVAVEPEAGAAAAPTPANRLSRPVAWTAALAAGAVIGLAAVGIGIAQRPAPPPGGANPPATLLPAAVSDLETRGLSAMFENNREQTAVGVGYLRQATLLAPRSAPTWGSLAMGYVLMLGWATPDERGPIVARVRDAASRALAIDPRETRSAAALASLVPTFGNWRAKAEVLDRAQQRARPDSGPLAYQRLQFLFAIGHTQQALALAETLVKASPLVPWIQAARIDLLATQGRLEEADRAADAALAIWPRDRLIWFTRFDLFAAAGQPRRALAMATDRSGWPRDTGAGEIELAARTVKAGLSRDSAAIDSVLRTHMARVGLGEGPAERAIRAASALGRPTLALALAERLYARPPGADTGGAMLPYIGLRSDSERQTALLYFPVMQALWLQPGFMPLMQRIGLFDHWRSAGAPDMCAAPGVAPICRHAGLSKPVTPS